MRDAMSEISELTAEDQTTDDEDKRQSYDDETEWWILASST
jgi:hypothetical protein